MNIDHIIRDAALCQQGLNQHLPTLRAGADSDALTAKLYSLVVDAEDKLSSVSTAAEVGIDTTNDTTLDGLQELLTACDRTLVEAPAVARALEERSADNHQLCLDIHLAAMYATAAAYSLRVMREPDFDCGLLEDEGEGNELHSTGEPSVASTRCAG